MLAVFARLISTDLVAGLIVLLLQMLQLWLHMRSWYSMQLLGVCWHHASNAVMLLQ